MASEPCSLCTHDATISWRKIMISPFSSTTAPLQRAWQGWDTDNLLMGNLFIKAFKGGPFPICTQPIKKKTAKKKTQTKKNRCRYQLKQLSLRVWYNMLLRNPIIYITAGFDVDIDCGQNKDPSNYTNWNVDGTDMILWTVFLHMPIRQLLLWYYMNDKVSEKQCVKICPRMRSF